MSASSKRPATDEEIAERVRLRLSNLQGEFKVIEEKFEEARGRYDDARRTLRSLLELIDDVDEGMSPEDLPFDHPEAK